ncbi:MAG TPA: hypothetical protein PLW10_16395 [Myxococcota bacterium]|nr:hypothetical protein [Myxococcales bacterium]HPG27216.1 hypothetical protein [Myxococcota bacterium]
MPAERPLLLATDADATHALAKGLDAELHALPSPSRPEVFEGWRAEVLTGAPRRAIVVAPWRTEVEADRLDALDLERWKTRFELPFLLWCFALGAAGRRCADGGAIVALAQTPAALDAPGLTPELAIGDGVLSLVRSVAAAEGARGVRANLVTTPIGLVGPDVIAPTPPLAGFPGRVESHLIGAVRMLLSPDAAGLTGRAVSADGGRSL